MQTTQTSLRLGGPSIPPGHHDLFDGIKESPPFLVNTSGRVRDMKVDNWQFSFFVAQNLA